LRRGIFVTDTLPQAARELLAGCDIFEREADDDSLGRCEVLMAWPTRAKGELLRKMKSLKMVQTMSAGVDAIDFSLLPPGTELFSNAGAFTDSVAEHAWGLLLGVAKGVHVRGQRAVPLMMKGKTLLVAGCGAIGSEVARLSRSLSMATIGVSRSFRAPELFRERRPLSDLKEVIGRADAVVIALPLTAHTNRIFGAEVLERAKESVVIVNVGRGEIVDREAVLAWLRARPESRYATDVFWKKDGKEDFGTPAWELPNFAGTLHDAGVPLGADIDSVKVEAAKNVRRFLRGEGPVNRIDLSEYVAAKL
jgi:phosphoglycerate dehydrogenase-like enzyme